MKIIHEPTYDPETGKRLTNMVIDCTCGLELELLPLMTNSCSCGREYNWAGQLLVPREQWGEETGEDWRDLGDLNDV